MPATFSWAQYTGSSGNSTTPANLAAPGLMATSSGAGMSWDFETADNTGTVTYTANPVSAGSASMPVWLKGYWTNTVAFTVSNLKFWQWIPTASAAATATFTVFGTSQTAYSFQTGTGTGAAYASNVQVPTHTSSTASPAGALGFGTANFGTTAGNSGVQTGGSAWLALQLSAAATAPAGTTGYFGYTMQYDEQ